MEAQVFLKEKRIKQITAQIDCKDPETVQRIAEEEVTKLYEAGELEFDEDDIVSTEIRTVIPDHYDAINIEWHAMPKVDVTYGQLPDINPLARTIKWHGGGED